jgi:hypothetical protein
VFMHPQGTYHLIAVHGFIVPIQALRVKARTWVLGINGTGTDF